MVHPDISSLENVMLYPLYCLTEYFYINKNIFQKHIKKENNETVDLHSLPVENFKLPRSIKIRPTDNKVLPTDQETVNIHGNTKPFKK